MREYGPQQLAFELVSPALDDFHAEDLLRLPHQRIGASQKHKRRRELYPRPIVEDFLHLLASPANSNSLRCLAGGYP